MVYKTRASATIYPGANTEGVQGGSDEPPWEPKTAHSISLSGVLTMCSLRGFDNVGMVSNFFAHTLYAFEPP